MSPVVFWNALSARRRAGFAVALLALAALMAGGGAWLLHDPLVPLVSEPRADRIAQLSQALEQARVAHRVTDDGHGVAVARSQLGKARAAAAGGGLAAPPSVGLEVFKDADFSTTDFAQRINYQRALQGELTRTLEALAGVRRARVHLILPEAGLLRRTSTPASAAIGLAMAEGHGLTRAQVRGIQRLVAASVPGLRPSDVAVFDEAGVSLGAPAAGEGEASTAQLDLKRQVDGYLEAKLARLLEEVVGDGQLSLSVDASLDERQWRVTTEEPVAAGAVGKADGERPAGVLTRERQVDRGAAAPSAGEADPAATPGEWEVEYRVGQRVEQTLAMPGSIRRLSVAVAVRGAAPELRAAAVEQLVAHGIGLDRARGDAVAVVLLSAVPANHAATAAAGTGMLGSGGLSVAEVQTSTRADLHMTAALPAQRASARAAVVTGATSATSAISDMSAASATNARRAASALSAMSAASAASATSSKSAARTASSESAMVGAGRSSGSVALDAATSALPARAMSAATWSSAGAADAAGASGAASDSHTGTAAGVAPSASALPRAPQAGEELDRPELGPAVVAGLGGLAGMGVLLPLALRWRARKAMRAPAGGAIATGADREAEADALAARIRRWLEGGD